ncbi:DUF2461 domain-containing protein [Spongiivirga citrea]|uniref:TIGR02453 family protein n=1 Tax=Spongiivirga citrea TaxID=1481457 RepID=A0A6M0CP76_9FLAO|nr:DUF2461 domain-containing protein [Spongiivirga citrea]NER17277.1 TIGR02453 family protein [Spongiivirga citrea]
MSFQNLFYFLHDLNKNNHKEWMDAHRKEYHAVRDWYKNWLEALDSELAKIDPNYSHTPSKKAINRINNNLMFHPNKPVYKDHFGAGVDMVRGECDFYIHLGINECFLASGFYKPEPKTLKSIRDAIDYNGEELKKILNKKSFKKYFPELMQDDILKTAPKGFAKDHPHIDLLRLKSFAVAHPITREQVLQDDFMEFLIAVYKEVLPFRNYLNEAVSV